jgi:hypothetical protein
MLYPGASGELGKIKSEAYLSNPAKQNVIGGVIKRIDVSLKCLQSLPCQHLEVSLWVSSGENQAVIPAGISSGLDVQCVYLLLGSPGWTGKKKGDKYDHFSSYLVSSEDVRHAKTLIRLAVDKWLVSIPDRTPVTTTAVANTNPTPEPSVVMNMVINTQTSVPSFATGANRTVVKIEPGTTIGDSPKKAIEKKKKPMYHNALKSAVAGLYDSLK